MHATPAPLGTSIRIFLANGEADGVWVVEKSNWTGKALMAPRTRYKELRSRPDLDGPGVYLLIGPTESGVPATRVYIGETDDLPGRLDSHNKNKDFWNRVIVFTSKDANLNKAHIRHLEGRLIALAKAANRAEIENGNTIEARRFYESPYTDVAPEGPDGLFEPADVARLITVVHELRSRADASSAAG